MSPTFFRADFIFKICFGSQISTIVFLILAQKQSMLGLKYVERLLQALHHSSGDNYHARRFHLTFAARICGVGVLCSIARKSG